MFSPYVKWDGLYLRMKSLLSASLFQPPIHFSFSQSLVGTHPVLGAKTVGDMRYSKGPRGPSQWSIPMLPQLSVTYSLLPHIQGYCSLHGVTLTCDPEIPVHLALSSHSLNVGWTNESLKTRLCVTWTLASRHMDSRCQ